MALIICEECGSQMSDKAQSCPKCGAPNPNVSMQAPAGFTFNPCAWHSNMPAVSSCVTCGRAMCKNCTDSVLFTVNNKPQCNECSLAMLAENIAANKKKKTWSIVKLVFLLFFILIGLIMFLSDPNSAMDAWICAGIGGLPSALKTFMTRSTEEKLVDEAMSRIDPGEGCTQQIMGLLVGAVFAVLLAPVAAIWFTIKNILAIVRSNRAIQADQEDYDTIQLRMQGKEDADSSANIPAQSEAPSQSGTPVQPAMPNQAPIHEEVHAVQPQQNIQASSATSTTSEVVAPSKSNNNKLIGIVAGALILFGFMVGYFLWYVPYAKDRDALRTYVIANTVLLRSSKMTDSEYNVVSKVPYGAELITYTKDSEWAEVKVDGVEGFAASPYLLEWSDFQLLDNVWGSVIVKECIESSKCRLAVLDYCKRNQFNTGFDGWQLYTLHKDMKPNMVLFPRLNNGHDKFTEFAFILKNNVTKERKLALYSFDEGSEMPIFLYEENAPADGEIKDIRFNSGRNKYSVSYTGNAPQKTNRATVQKEEKKQPSVEPQQVKETPEPAPSATKAEAIDNSTAAIVGETKEDTRDNEIYTSATSRPVENRTYTVNGVSFTMIAVEGGTFMMGSTKGIDHEAPVHKVTLSSYTIGETEVTQELWLAIMGKNPSNIQGNLQRPVERISWNDCQTFISKLNELTGEKFRLPTEAEWEFAARGGNTSNGYKFSGSDVIDEVAWYYNNSSGTTHPVKTKNANELGIYDMSGNVYEWCADRYSRYSSSSETNPQGPSYGSYRIFRGGRYNYGWGECRVTQRAYNGPDTNGNGVVGLRLAQ